MISRVGTTAVACVAGLFTWFLSVATLRAQAPTRWAACYSRKPVSLDLARYDVVVLDPVEHPPLAPMLERDRIVLAYLSLTEMGTAHEAFADLERAGVALEAHPTWTTSRYVDFRRPEWSRAVLEQIIPRALDAGFTGLFLDTLDDAEFLEGQDAAKYRGMREAAVRLVRAIRHQYPNIRLMVNRGYALLPDIAGSIDFVLGESVMASFDPNTKAYARVADADVEWQVNELRKAKALNPSLEIFTLDYWDPADVDGVRQIYRRQRANGFVPYVSTPMLDRLVKEPQ